MHIISSSSILKNLVLCLLTVIISKAEAQQKDTEYADILVDAKYSKANKQFNQFYGGTLRNYPITVSLQHILGNDSTHFVSLPKNSYVIVKFTDNLIIDYPNQDDIFITELGCSGERAEVSISENGTDYTLLGIVDDCKTSSLDLASINYKKTVIYVKIKGLDNKGNSPGYDLVNIKGLPNSTINTYAPLDSLEKLLIKPDSELQPKIILKNVVFDLNSSQLKKEAIPALDTLAFNLIKHKNIEIKIIGHTDNTGLIKTNQSLSLSRANAVKDYLISKGISASRIKTEGKGETEPLKSNDSEKGKAINRRVEFVRI